MSFISMAHPFEDVAPAQQVTFSKQRDARISFNPSCPSLLSILP